MRPTSLAQVIGQDEIVGERGFLRTLISNESLVSMILFGPAGTGKTTIAEAFCKDYKVNYIKLNAVTSNKEEMQQAIRESRLFDPTIIIMDEVHRLNKDKQDLFLPYLEAGDFYLIGATTANPLLSINKAIRSRTRLLEVKKLRAEEIIVGLRRAVVAPEGLDNSRQFEDSALNYIAKIAGGDLRYAYNILETAALSFLKNHLITEEDVRSLNYFPNALADKDDEEHYDTVSAFQKSIRGSEVDAAIFYLAKLLVSRDLEGTIRRLLITAYEDVGLANPAAVDRCYNACQVALGAGLPEAMIPLAFTVVDLALSPKSKSACLAIENAMAVVENRPTSVRDYLRLTPVSASEEDKYPYDRPDLWELIEYLPENLETAKFYEPNLQSKYESNLFINYDRLIKQARSASLRLLKNKKTR